MSVCRGSAGAPPHQPRRSLQDGVHYVQFWNRTGTASYSAMDDVYETVAAVRRKAVEDPGWPHRIIHSAQTFALT